MNKNNITEDYKKSVIHAKNVRQAREEEKLRIEHLEAELAFVCEQYTLLLQKYKVQERIMETINILSNLKK